MPAAALRPCGQPGCPALVRRGRCPKHERAREQARGTAHVRGYGRRWQRYRLSFLAANPLCVLCAHAGLVTAASVVDHIRAHRGDEALFWDPANHRALCKPCHDARTEEGDFGR